MKKGKERGSTGGRKNILIGTKNWRRELHQKRANKAREKGRGKKKRRRESSKTLFLDTNSKSLTKKTEKKKQRKIKRSKQHVRISRKMWRLGRDIVGGEK